MTIDEAIKGSEEAVIFLGIHNQQRLALAVNLGLEALRAIKRVRPTEYDDIDLPLPGETEE